MVVDLHESTLARHQDPVPDGPVLRIGRPSAGESGARRTRRGPREGARVEVERVRGLTVEPPQLSQVTGHGVRRRQERGLAGQGQHGGVLIGCGEPLDGPVGAPTGQAERALVGHPQHPQVVRTGATRGDLLGHTVVLGHGVGHGQPHRALPGAALGHGEPRVGESRRAQNAPAAWLLSGLLRGVHGAVLDRADQVVAPDLESLRVEREGVPPRAGQRHGLGERALPGARVLLGGGVERGHVAASVRPVERRDQHVRIVGRGAEPALVLVGPALLARAGVASHDGAVGVHGDQVALRGERCTATEGRVRPQGVQTGRRRRRGAVDGLFGVRARELGPGRTAGQQDTAGRGRHDDRDHPGHHEVAARPSFGSDATAWCRGVLVSRIGGRRGGVVGAGAGAGLLVGAQ